MTRLTAWFRRFFGPTSELRPEELGRDIEHLPKETK